MIGCDHFIIYKTLVIEVSTIGVVRDDCSFSIFTASTAGSTITFNWSSGSDVKTSTDGGVNWSTYTAGDLIALASVGDKVSFKGTDVTEVLDCMYRGKWREELAE